MSFTDDDSIEIKFQGQNYDVYHCKESNQLVIGIRKDKEDVIDVEQDMLNVYALNSYLKDEGFFPEYFDSLN